MNGVAGQKDAPLAVTVRQQQIHLPLADIKHVVFDRHGDDPFEHTGHFRVRLHDRMQRGMPGRILADRETPLGADNVRVPALADWDALVDVLARIARLPRLLAIRLYAELYAEVLAYHT